MRITPITEKAQVMDLRDRVRKAVSSSWELDTAFLTKNNWVAVPVHAGEGFTQKDYESIVSTVSFLGHPDLYAVPTEPFEQFPDCLKVPATVEGLSELESEFGPYSFALVPSDVTFLILLTHADFHLVAGPQSIVESLLHQTVDQLRRRFRNFVEAYPIGDTRESKAINKAERTRLLAALEAYQ